MHILGTGFSRTYPIITDCTAQDLTGFYCSAGESGTRGEVLSGLGAGEDLGREGRTSQEPPGKVVFSPFDFKYIKVRQWLAVGEAIRAVVLSVGKVSRMANVMVPVGPNVDYGVEPMPLPSGLCLFAE